MKKLLFSSLVVVILALAFLAQSRVAVVRLHTTDASDAAKMVSDVCGPTAFVVAMPIGESRLLVIASPKVVKDVSKLIREVDL
jgi:hypothetical protein